MQKQFVAMKAFIVNENDDTIFLMHKGQKDILNPGKWEVPGGKMEFGEMTTETFKREVKEECGLDIEVGDRLLQPWQWTFTKNNGDKNQIIAVGKICKVVSGDIDFSNQTATDDLVECRWVPVEEVLNYDLIPNLVSTMESFVKMYINLKSNGKPVFIPEKEQPLATYYFDEEKFQKQL